MPLSSSSTLADVKAAYLDAASYYENQSTSQALAFTTACRALLLLLPSETKSAAGSEFQFDPAQIRLQLEEATQFLKANGIYPGSSAPASVETSFEFSR